MIFEGLKLMAIRLAVQYGDGQALASFWKDGMISYTRAKKVHRQRKGFWETEGFFKKLDLMQPI